MQVEAGLQRVAVVDCDVHQGNGTASIFAGDDSVFTFSIHGARNFPFAKEKSDLDIELPDGTGTMNTCGTWNGAWTRRWSAPARSS
jgi:acetoin utilization deacetylase AcuC-like enzyme